MSLQAYLDTIRETTGETPDDFRAYAVWQGYLHGGALRPDLKASKIVADLKRDFGLGRGHALAVYALLRSLRTENDN